MIDVTCEKCSASFSLKDELAGKKGKCTCGEILNVPELGEKTKNNFTENSEIKTLSLKEIFMGLKNIDGRYNRRQFLIVLGISMLGVLIAYSVVGNSVLMLAIQIISAGLTIMAAGKRFHDMNLSGGYILLLLLFGLNIIIILWLAIGKGTDGANKYGNPVK